MPPGPLQLPSTWQPQESIPDGTPHSGPCASLHRSSRPRLIVKAKGRASAPRPCRVNPFLSERSPFPCPPLAALRLYRIMPLTAHHPGSLSLMQGPIGPLPRRCTRKSQCRRATQPNQWLWTYENGLCLHIQSVLPAHHPRQEQGQVSPIFLLSFCLCPHPPCMDPSASALWPPPKAPPAGLPFMCPRSPYWYPGCPPWLWMNTSIAPLATMTAWLMWKGPSWPASPLPRTSCH